MIAAPAPGAAFRPRVTLACAMLLLLGLAGPAHAEVLTLPSTKATLDLPATWKRVEAVDVVVGAHGPAGEVLAITRAAVPNPDAWRPKTRDAYLDQIEKGLAARVAGYRRVARKVGETNRVPTLDLEAKRADGATIVVRVLMFRTYALSLAIEVPARGAAGHARALAKTFVVPAG